MNKRHLVIILGILVVSFFALKSYYSHYGNNVACTMEAKICPDGSAVGRIAPYCEFALCPGSTTTPIIGNKGYLSGRVTISPTCPVERFPPEPQCAPKGYATGIFVNSNYFHKQISSDANGYFSLELNPGIYSLVPVVANVLPRCNEVDDVVIKAGTTTSVQIDCDSGIR